MNKALKHLLRLIGIIVIVAFTNTPQKVSDKKAKDILEQTSKKIQSFKSIKIDFTLTEVSDKKNNSSLKGRVLIKGNKYNLRLAGQEVFCDGKTKWTYIKDAEEVHISTVKENDDELANPLNMLKNYQKRFTSRWIKEETMKGKKADVVDLYPKVTKGYYKVRLMICKSSKQILSSTVYHINNSSHTIEIDKFTTNEHINDALFIWDIKKYSEVEVIDLRKKG